MECDILGAILVCLMSTSSSRTVDSCLLIRGKQSLNYNDSIKPYCDTWETILNSFPKQLADMFLIVNCPISFTFLKWLRNSRISSLSADLNLKRSPAYCWQQPQGSRNYLIFSLWFSGNHLRWKRVGLARWNTSPTMLIMNKILYCVRNKALIWKINRLMARPLR